MLRKISLGGGYLYKQLNKDVKEINKVFLSLFSVGIILIAIFVGVNITKSSYALFSDKIKGEKTIEVEVDNNLDKSGANKPMLDDNMIAVYYDEEANVWRKADSENKRYHYKWYDYDNKMWANSVTVKETNREAYLKAELGTEISMDDILTMQVWVPRYKYKVWNYNSDGVTYSNPKEIEIVFEKKVNSTGTVKCIDDLNNINGSSESCYDNENNGIKDNVSFYTHPAFTFGSEELEGFWVGKFELTGTIDNITVKPNETSIRNYNVSSFETNIMTMNDSGNKYGFETSDDTHVMKNMEWGAVAYLSHSKYGTCTDGECNRVGKNNNSNYITGCGDSYNSSASANCNSYETELGMASSTTGNIYGIYDMSGGSHEYIMGNTVYDDEVMISGSTTDLNSGYSGIIYNSGAYTSYTGEYSYPEDKYYDKYSSGATLDFKRGKLGDASKEVKMDETSHGNWYSQGSNMPNNAASWVLRGANFEYSTSAGIFSHNYHYGNAVSTYSSRLVIKSSKKSENRMNSCEFYGPYSTSSLNTEQTSYAYDGDKIYYNLICNANSGIEAGQISIENIKSSNDKMLKATRIVSETYQEIEEHDWKGYSYVIEAEVYNDGENVEKPYIYIEPYTVKSLNNYYDDGAKSDGVRVGLLRANKQNNAKDVLTCNSISLEKEEYMEKVLEKRIEKVGSGTRQAVVEAARFLALEFPYAISYYWTDGIKDYPKTGYYLNKGLYLSKDDDDSSDDAPWGCDREKQALEMGIFKIGEKYPNGLECSGFTTWALINGGFEETGGWYTEIFKESSQSGKVYMYQNTYNPETHSLGYSNIFDYYMADSAKAKLASDTWANLDPSSKVCINSSCGLSDYNEIDNYDIKAGDLIWKKGHVGMVIGIVSNGNNTNYYVSEATYTLGTYANYSYRGLRTVMYTTSELYNSSVGWTHVVKMDDIYGDGNLTNYKPYW